MGLIGDPVGQVRVAPGGRRPLQLVPPPHVGAAAREKGHGRPVFEPPLDRLVETDVQSEAEDRRAHQRQPTGTFIESVLHARRVVFLSLIVVHF